jgi:hypothetical protein
MLGTHRLLTGLIYASAACGALALVCLDAALPPDTRHEPDREAVHGTASGPEARVFIERVDFVLETASQPKADEAQKKRKAQEHRAAAPKLASNSGAYTRAASQPGRTAPTQVQHQPKEANTQPAAQDAAQGTRAPTAEAPSTLPLTPAPVASASSSSAKAPLAAATAPAPAPVVSSQPPGPTAGTPQTKPQAQAQSPAAPGQASASVTASVNNRNSTPSAQAAGALLPKLTREQLLTLLPGAEVSRTNTAGSFRHWTNKPDGTLTVYWVGHDGHRIRARTADGHWSISDDGRFCLHVDWDDAAEDWCRFLMALPNDEYQPIADTADANWTPPTDKSNWRPLHIKR